MDSTLLVIIAGIVGLASGFAIAKVIEKSNVSNLIKNAKKEATSILKDAKVEAENIKKNLPLILSQVYPDYEVVVVNDCSTDNTSNILESFALLADILL